MRASRNIRIAAVAAALSIGGLALSSPAFAANTPDPTGLNFSISNPAQASLTLSSQNVSLVSAGVGANLSAATAAPHVTFQTAGGKAYTGGVEALVESDDPLGYTLTLNGSAGGITSAGHPAIDWFDLNIVTDTVGAGPNGGVQVSTDNHFTAAAGDDPTTNGVTVLNASGPSGVITDTRTSGGGTAEPLDTTTGLTPDSIQTAYYVQPKSGMLAGASYAGTAEFTFVGK